MKDLIDLHVPRRWMSLREAAAYLSLSPDAVERRLTEMHRPERGKFRFTRFDESWNAISDAPVEQQRALPIRVLASDVYAVLPLPGQREEAV